jgi:hypothetical protein
MADPIRWTRKGDRSHERNAFMWQDGKRVPVLDDFGRQVKERVPVTGRVGVVRQEADVATTKPMRDPRALHYLHTDGNEAHSVIRSAAASLHGNQNTDRSQLEFVKAKAKHEGWILVGECPVDLVVRRELNKLQMFSMEVRAACERGEACRPDEVGANKPPCKHYVAERDARRGIRTAENKAMNDAQTSAAERTATAIGELVARLPPQTLAPPAEAPASEPTKPPKGPGK